MEVTWSKKSRCFLVEMGKVNKGSSSYTIQKPCSCNVRTFCKNYLGPITWHRAILGPISEIASINCTRACVHKLDRNLCLLFLHRFVAIVGLSLPKHMLHFVALSFKLWQVCNCLEIWIFLLKRLDLCFYNNVCLFKITLLNLGCMNLQKSQ